MYLFVNNMLEICYVVSCIGIPEKQGKIEDDQDQKEGH
jgi:hypothetical protein